MRLGHITLCGYKRSQFIYCCSGDFYRGLKRSRGRDTDKAQAFHILNHYQLTATVYHFKEKPGQSQRGEAETSGLSCPLL